MITKVLKPEQHGSVVYDNKDSSARLVNYMEHEAKTDGQPADFFNHARDGIAKETVIEHIDNNVKGLKKEDAKFYSLVISPSQDELKHLGGDEQKLKAYTRQVMENYAQNFKLKDGKTLHSEDLVWYATIHRERKYSGTDREVREGKARSGEVKPGDQTHVHIIVSRRDAGQEISLTPVGRKERFNIQRWQAKNAEDFRIMFGYEQKTHYGRDAYKEQKLRERLGQFLEKEGIDKNYFHPDRVVFLAKEQQFDWKFYRNLRTLEKSLREGLRPKDPYEGLHREDILKQYQKQRGYAFEDTRDSHTMNRLVNFRYNFLKEHGFPLSDNAFNVQQVLQVGHEHPQRWKFMENLTQLQRQVSAQGRVPENYLEILSRTATREEQSARQQVKDGRSPGTGPKPISPQEVSVPQGRLKGEPVRREAFEEGLSGGKGKTHGTTQAARAIDSPAQRGGGGKLAAISSLFNSIAKGAGIAKDDSSWSGQKPGPKRIRRLKIQRNQEPGMEL